ETILGLHPAERHHRVPKDFGWGNRLKALGLAVALRGSRRYCSAIRARQAQIQRPVQTRGPCGGGISRRRPDVGALTQAFIWRTKWVSRANLKLVFGGTMTITGIISAILIGLV